MKKKYLITRNRSVKEDSSMHENIHYFKTLNFYQLNIGDKFYFKKRVYKKIDEETGRMRNGHKKHFWPTIDVRIEKPMQLDDLVVKYPITAYFN